MGFESVQFVQFRNLNDRPISLERSREIFLIGENGQGKTNFLEGIYLLSYGSSFRTQNLKKIAQLGFQEFSALGNWSDDDESRQVSFRFTPLKKEIRVDGNPIRDRKDLVHNSPCIAFTHQDYQFVQGSPEFQRYFFDQTLSLYDLTYIDTLRNYKKILKTRNALLVQNYDSVSMDVWEEQLVKTGAEITRARRSCIEEFNKIFSDLFTQVSLLPEICSIRYSPSWKEGDERTWKKTLEDRRSQDRALCFTSSGPHRDRFSFVYAGKNFVDSASTGQIRLISLILRVSQSLFLYRKTGKKPVLLLDDVLLELDGKKRQRFLSLLPPFDQAFFTFLPEERVDLYQTTKPLYLDVKEGALTPHG